MAALDSLTEGLDLSDVDLHDVASATGVVVEAKDRGQSQRQELLENVNAEGTMSSGDAAGLQYDLAAVEIQEIGSSISAEKAIDMTLGQSKKTESKS